MNGSHHDEFWKSGLHRELSEGEQAAWRARLSADAPERARFDEELRLNEFLRELPDAPVSSNFTARVMQLVEQEDRARQRGPGAAWWRGFLSFSLRGKLAFASALVFLGFLSVQQYQLAERRELARSVAHMSSVTQPALEVIHDIREIEGLHRVSLTAAAEDVKLIEALQP